jgi:hypothetical protein
MVDIMLFEDMNCCIAAIDTMLMVSQDNNCYIHHDLYRKTKCCVDCMFLLACRYPDFHGKTCFLLPGSVEAISFKHSLTTTLQSSSSSAGPTATQCAASNNYGNIYIEDAYDTESAVLDFLFPYTYENNPPGFCCNLCYQTPGCYGFTEGLAESGSTYTYCELAVIPSNSPIGPNVSPKCPTGQYSWPQANLSPWVAGSTGGSGQGPCGIFP